MTKAQILSASFILQSQSLQEVQEICFIQVNGIYAKKNARQAHQTTINRAAEPQKSTFTQQKFPISLESEVRAETAHNLQEELDRPIQHPGCKILLNLQQWIRI